MVWAAYPPERNSAGFWLGFGAGSYFASAATLESVAAMLTQILGGHQGVVAALNGTWMGPTGQLATAAQQPYLAWLATSAGMLGEAGAAIAALGQAFEDLKAATPTPGEVAHNQAEHVVLQMNNFLGLLTGLIIANRIAYKEKWIRAASNMYAYSGVSASTVGAIPPLPPPPPSGMPAPDVPMSAVGEVAEKAAKEPAEAAAKSMDAGAMSTMMPMLSQLTSMPSQLGQVVQTPMQGLGQLTQLPMQAMQPLMGLGQQFGGMAGTGDLANAANASWLSSATTAGGPVSASLGGGGGGGGAGIAGAGAMSAMRGPVSWSSTVNAAGPTAAEPPVTSRFAEARAVNTTPASTGMGMPGAMMAPLAHRAGEGGDQQHQTSLSDPAVLYRVPTDIPVVTGDGGARFPRGEGDK